MSDTYKFHREVTPLSKRDSFLVFDRIKDGFDFPIHYHPEYEINFIQNGSGVKRVVGDHIEEIEEVELVLVGPNLHHGWETHNCRSRRIHEITIQFHNDLFEDSFLSRRVMLSIKDMLEKSIHGILFSNKTALEIGERLKKLSKLDGIDNFLEFLSILYDMSNSRNQRLLSTYTVDNFNFEEDDKMKTVYDYVQQNFSEKISLDEVADLLSMSVVSFNRFIKKRTNKTFVNYLNDIRVGYASRWLIEKDLSIAEIAYKAGFNNIANFNRIFKSKKNTTPSQYREEFNGMKRFL